MTPVAGHRDAGTDAAGDFSATAGSLVPRAVPLYTCPGGTRIIPWLDVGVFPVVLVTGATAKDTGLNFPGRRKASHRTVK